MKPTWPNEKWNPQSQRYYEDVRGYLEQKRQQKAYFIHYDLHGSRRWGTTCWIRCIRSVADQEQALRVFWSGRFGRRRRQDVVIREVVETQDF